MPISTISHVLSGPAERDAYGHLDNHADKLHANRETALIRCFHMTLLASSTF